MKQFSERVVVITGASSGVGRAMANVLARKKCTLVLAGRNQHTLNQVAEECREAGAQVQAVVADMRITAEVAGLAMAAAAINGTIDVWINNAGVLAAGTFEEIPSIVNENVILTNLIGYINGAQHVLPYFKVQGYGILINNISVGGWFPTPYAAAYTASKFGLRGFSEALKGELTGYPNIHVTDIYPGFLDTPGIQHAANYTGKVIKPAPPVYDPFKIANVVAELIENPKCSKTIGVAPAFLRFSYNAAPSLTRRITGAVIRTYLRKAKEIERTPGNVMRPVEFGTSITGGWKRKLQPKKSTVAISIFGVFATLLLLAGKK